MKFAALLMVLVSYNTFACWKMQGTLSYNETKIQIDQKMDHDKTYSFPAEKLIYHVKVVSDKNKPECVPKKPGTHLIDIRVEEKTGTTLKEVSAGLILVKTGKEATMTKKDNQTGENSIFIVKLTEI